MDDEVIRGATVIQEGTITWPPPAPTLSASKARPQTDAPAEKIEIEDIPLTMMARFKRFLPLIIIALVLYGFGLVAPESFMSHFTVFVLACFVGYQVIWNVSASLHTPLMSVTNAISGIIVIGALVQISTSNLLITV